MKKLVECPECNANVRKVGSELAIIGHLNGCSFGLYPNISEIEKQELNEKKKTYQNTGRIPYRYQQEKGLDWIRDGDHSKFGLLWEMRLGKTLVVIKMAQEKGIKYPLVVCPLSVAHTWEEELKLEGCESVILNTKTIRNLEAFIGKIPNLWHITNYESLIKEDLSKFNWDLIVLDESHRIRSPETKISRTLCSEYYVKDKKDPHGRGKLHSDFSNVPNKVIMTGTPSPENLLEYFQQMKFLYGEFGGTSSWWQFKNRFFDFIGNNTYRPRYGMDHFIADELAQKCSVLKREHAGIGGKTIYEKRYVTMEGDYLQEYERLEKDWCSEEYDLRYAIQVYNILHQFTGGFPKNSIFESDHKMREMIHLLRNDLKGEQVVVWCRYLSELNAVNYYIKKHNQGPIALIHGNVPIEKRHALRKAFQAGKYRILACQVRTGSLGLDMSAADTAIIISNEFGAVNRSQMVDRLVHPEKKSPNLIIDIITEDSVCELVYNMLQRKIANQESMLKVIHDKIRSKYENRNKAND